MPRKQGSKASPSLRREDNEVLTFEQALGLLKTTKATLYRWLAQDRLQGFKAGRQWRFYRKDLIRFLERGEPATGPVDSEAVQAALDMVRQWLRNAKKEAPTVDRLPRLGESALPPEGLSADEETVARLAELVIGAAFVGPASDIHLDPTRDGLWCRVRIDGVLHELATFAKSVQQPLLNRLKLMADIDLGEQRLPQNGRIRLQVQGGGVDVFLATLPSIFGEKVVMRLIDPFHALVTLDKVGLSRESMAALRRALHSPTGMVLFTGPTGSGKTTVMYGGLQEITTAEKNVLSVEDPVEVSIPGVTQVHVNVRAGLTFETVLRQFQRSDPDVIMVGEVSDLKTAEVCVQAAITGHLVLTTLHTHDAPQALVRLVEMGIEPFMIAESVICVVSQRLARRVCSECGKPVELAPELLARVRAQAEAGGLKWPAKASFRKGAGCPRCRGTGYRGRTALFQVMPMTSELSRLLVAGASLEELRAEAVRGGTKTLLADGIQKAIDGITTVEEVLRVTTLQ